MVAEINPQMRGDDDAVRLMTKRTLESFGYQVLEAASGRKALEFWPNCASDIDLLLTDLVMPDGINGREFVERLRAQTPSLKAIFVRGYSLNALSKDTDFLNRCETVFCKSLTIPKFFLRWCEIAWILFNRRSRDWQKRSTKCRAGCVFEISFSGELLH